MKRRRGSVSLAMALAVGVTWLGAGVAFGQANPNSKLCFKNVIGVPGAFYQRPPQIDGCLRLCDYPNDSPQQHDDFGWQSAFTFIANPISQNPPQGDVIAQGIYDPAGAGSLDMAFDVKNDTRIDETDAVVIAMKATVPNHQGDHALIIIYPFLNHGGSAYSGPIGTGQVGQIQYIPGTLNGSDVTWNLNDIVSGPSWISAAVNSGGGGSSWAWTVEVQMKRNGQQTPDAINVTPGGFDFFFDVIRIYDQQQFKAFDMPWPPAATNGSEASSPPTPGKNQWGLATINSGVCGGVAFDPADIKTNQTDPTEMSKDPQNPNRFSVTLKNTLIDTRPGPNQNKPMAAQAVTAKFRIANFGLPANIAWTPIPGGNDTSNTDNVPAATTNPANSTVPPGTINTAGSVTLTTPTPGWVPDAQWTTANWGHQCILAELSSPTGDVVFTNRSAYQNMHYGTNPDIEPVAFIDGRWGEPPSGQSAHTFEVLKIPVYQYAYGDGLVEGIPTGRLTAQLNLTFIGYRHSGRFVTLQNHKVELVTPVGYYGYLARHLLADEAFEKDFTARHKNIISWAFDWQGTLEEKWARVNSRLKDDEEKPVGGDWSISFSGLKEVPGTGGVLSSIQVPKDSVTKVTGKIKYSKGGGGRDCFHCFGSSGSSTVKTGAVLLIALSGLSAYRKRRRRG